MRNPIILILAVVFVAITSCRKNYQCRCTTTAWHSLNPPGNDATFKFQASSRKDAKAKCAAYEETPAYVDCHFPKLKLL